MSTIEKAAARLVAKGKPKTETVTPGDIAEEESITPAPDEQGRANDLSAYTDDAQPHLSLEQTAEPAAEAFTAPEPAQAGENAEAKPRRQPSAAYDHRCELDFEWLAESGFLVPGHENPQQSQDFRRIKRPLLLNAQPKLAEHLSQPTNVIFVTSAVPGEGKTFVSMNLALSMAAELDKRVLLIDGDADA